MIRFKLNIAGEVQMDRGIQRFTEGIADYRPVWPVIEDDFYATEKDQFKSEGAEGGDSWQPLSPAYAAWKEAHFAGKPILQREGDLMASLTSGNDPNAVKIEERRTLTLGSKVPYAIYHQSLAERKSRLPRRPEINLPEAFKRSVMHHIQAYLVEIASKSGFRSGLAPTSSARAGGYFGAGSWAGAGQNPVKSVFGGLNF